MSTLVYVVLLEYAKSSKELHAFQFVPKGTLRGQEKVARLGVNIKEKYNYV